MKAKQIIFFLVLPLLADLLIVGCCDCPVPSYLDYSNCEVTLSNIDNSGAQIQVSTNDTIIKEAFGLDISISLKESFCKLENPVLFSTSAYAFGCHCIPELTYSPIDSATSISVTTLSDFDATHPKNSDVTEYFNTESFGPVSELLVLMNQPLYQLNSNNNTYTILLMTSPSLPDEHQFKVVISYADGKILESTSPTVFLK